MYLNVTLVYKISSITIIDKTNSTLYLEVSKVFFLLYNYIGVKFTMFKITFSNPTNYHINEKICIHKF